jgi:hypothetical protein
VGQEFPVVLREKVVAGKTPVGTAVQSRLVLATLVSGKVIPRNAVFSGKIIESKAKTASEPARLSIHFDSAEWKNGSAKIHVYLTSWYYPMTLGPGPDLRYGPEQPARKTWSGLGEYPDNSPGYKPFSDVGEAAAEPTGANHPLSMIAKRPMRMKNVECQRDSSGRITLVGNHSNIKLDKVTTYVLASSDRVVSGPN